MFGQGYVGTAEDAAKLRRLQKQREEQKQKHDLQHQQTIEKGAMGALRQFGTSANEVRARCSRSFGVCHWPATLAFAIKCDDAGFDCDINHFALRFLSWRLSALPCSRIKR